MRSVEYPFLAPDRGLRTTGLVLLLTIPLSSVAWPAMEPPTDADIHRECEVAVALASHLEARIWPVIGGPYDRPIDCRGPLQAADLNAQSMVPERYATKLSRVAFLRSGAATVGAGDMFVSAQFELRRGSSGWVVTGRGREAMS